MISEIMETKRCHRVKQDATAKTLASNCNQSMTSHSEGKLNLRQSFFPILIYIYHVSGVPN